MKNNLETYTPTAKQISKTNKAVEKHFVEWYFHRNKREGCNPFSQIHELGKPIYGNVLLFHGFSAKPMQMFFLGDYLFRNGFNIYHAGLAGHSFVPPDSYWPQVDLKPEYIEPLRKIVNEDPILRNFFSNLRHQPPSKSVRFSASVARLLRIAPNALDITLAIERRNDQDFERYYISSHMNYLTEAQKCLEDFAAMPGPVYTVGLSVGGAVALALAANRPDRVKKVVAYAPLLEVANEVNERYINLTGPLDLREFYWEQNISFPVGCLTAANRFGAFVRGKKNVQALQKIPTLLVLTENEDAADVKTNQKFFKAIKSKQHRYYCYPETDLVPHPMVDPFQVSQGMTNLFWKTLYQETYRFLTAGEINTKNMSSLDEASDLPAIPEY